jgi:PIN domain nuclease of toxin-antitoxin system
VSESVWDASAVLALLQEEAGWEALAAEPPGIVGSVNLSEVVAKLADAGMPEEAIRSALSELSLDVRRLDEEQALRAGMLRPATRALGLSLGDRCCLALGAALGLPVLTTDRRWGDVEVEVGVRVAR